MIKDFLYVSDLDGTLLGPQHTLLPETVAILKALILEGLDLVVATARNFASASQLMAPVDYKGYYILANGALIADASGQPIWSASMTKTLLAQIDAALAFKRSHAMYSSLSGGNHLEIPQDAAWAVKRFEAYRRSQGFSAFVIGSPLTQVFTQEVITVTYMLEAHEIQPCLLQLEKAGLTDLLAIYPMPYPGLEGLFTLTIQPKDTNKGQALLQLKKVRAGMGIAEKKVIAFGDQLNDLELFSVSNQSYAVADAHPALKAQATAVIGSNAGAAVARWIASHGCPRTRIDERDIMFARMRYHLDPVSYKDYYTRHPEREEPDEVLRAMPSIFGEGTATFHPQLSPFGEAGFEVISALKLDAEQLKGPRVAKHQRPPIDPEAMGRQLADFAKFLGCDDVGFVAVAEDDLYSYKGRESYGRPIENRWPQGIMLIKAMDKTAVNRAPQLEASFAVVKAYMDLATIGLWLSKYIEHLGYNATAHIDGHYEAFLPALAEKAGLGAIGRANLLIHPTHGMSLRLAMVTTDLPLKMDVLQAETGVEPAGEGDLTPHIKAFCDHCQRCASTCPGKAISTETIRFDEKLGVGRWPFVQEDCYAVWRRLGTDCGVCLSSCPWTQGLTEAEQNLLRTEGPAVAYAAYQARQPLRQYRRESLPWLTYPAPVRF